jgi:predicted GIY-YIG superfamily endonuclease
VTFYVYALSASDGAIRYVGKSRNPAGRLAGHRSKSAAAAVRAWIESLGCAPELQILGSYPTETEALVAEGEWIQRLRQTGHSLLNGIRGIDVPRTHREPKFSGFGDRCRSLRMDQNLSQRGLALKAGVGETEYCRIEHGVRRNVSAVKAVLLARALGCSVDWLVTGEVPAEAAAE